MISGSSSVCLALLTGIVWLEWVLVGAALLLLLLLLWWWLGPGPRRRRQVKRVRHLLQQGHWPEALVLVKTLQQKVWSRRGDKKLNQAASECHQAAAQHYLREKDFEKALAERQRAAELAGTDPVKEKTAVVEEMLDEVRRQFSHSQGAETDAVHKLIGRTLILHSPCPEASFWQALCYLREGNSERAAAALESIVAPHPDPLAGPDSAAPPNRFIDPPLYLGALRLQQGQPKESLRYLGDANRIDSHCPVVICALGIAMMAAGGDTQIAMRALQRALGSRGFGLWSAEPERVWVEGFPDAASYIRRLARKYPYTCPLWGRDTQPLQRQGTVALAEGHYRLGQYEQAAQFFQQAAQKSAPSVQVLRGLGLALARLGKYDEAFKHLHAAYELEQPKTHLTAGYLALCGARGKPAQPEDKINNVNWAVWLVRGFQAPGDAEWVGLLNEIFAEARACGAPLERVDQLHLCEQLLSLPATDVQAAAAYAHLQATYPEEVRPEYAWLYGRAAQLHSLNDTQTPALFEKIFQTETAARAFYAEHGWNFDDLEFTYLERCAVQQPGQFPTVLGPAYSARAEQMLLQRARQAQAAGQVEAAQTALDILVKLDPHNAAAHDALAQLYYQQGQPERAIELLEAWRKSAPAAVLPLQRLAILYQQQDNLGEARRCLQTARPLTTGKERAAIDLLGVRLLLRPLLANAATSREDEEGQWTEILDWLKDALQHDPEQTTARWWLAASYCLRGDWPALAVLIDEQAQAGAAEPADHLLTAICHLAAGNSSGVQQSCRHIAGDAALAGEAAYVQAWAAIADQQPEAAADCLTQVIEHPDSPSVDHARALLGGIRFHQQAYAQAAELWQAIAPERRSEWQLKEPLAQTAFLAALNSLQQRHYADAAQELREAGRLGLRERRLAPLLMLVLVKAGQQGLYGEPAAAQGQPSGSQPQVSGERS